MKRKTRIFLGLTLIAIAILLLISLLKFGSLFAFLWVFPSIAELLHDELGLNQWLSNIIAIIPAIGVMIGLNYVFSMDKTKRRIGFAVAIVCYLAFCTFMYFMQSGRNFDPKTGEAQICFAEGLDGYEAVPCNWKFHEQTGKPVIRDKEKIDKIIQSQNIRTKGLTPVKTVEITNDLRFFTPEGTPLFWYYETPTGEIDVFDEPGRHPQYNTILIPINSEIVQKLLNPKSQKELQKIRLHPSNSSEKQATNENDNSDNPLQALKDRLEYTKSQLQE